MFRPFLLSTFVLGFNALTAQQTIDLSMGAGYASDVYYSLANGQIRTEPALNWDLAFTARTVDAAILINEAKGVKAWVAANDTNDWANLDTSGMRAFPLHNSTEAWEVGALNNTGSGAHPDYGWGTYNQITHDVNGSRIFVLQWADGSYSKLLIKYMKASGLVSFRYAPVSGSFETTVTVNKQAYTGKNFFYFDAQNEQFLDREPLSNQWDLVFRRYLEGIQAGPSTVWYPVTGVQTNLGLGTAEVRDLLPPIADSALYSRDALDISRIGSDWKYFDNTAFQWFIPDSLSFFVASKAGGIYQVYFTAFSGSSTGNLSFVQRPSNIFSSPELELNAFALYPNPASDYFEVSALETPENLSIVDMQGRVLRQIERASGRISVADLPVGVYALRWESQGRIRSARLVVNR
jgi:hypothetical protein